MTHLQPKFRLVAYPESSGMMTVVPLDLVFSARRDG
jgi:hypothetical protein